MGTHEALFRSHFAKRVNKIACSTWYANQNIVWRVAKQEGASKGATANGKPDGYVLQNGHHHDVELKASDVNGLYTMGNPTLPADDSEGPGWRQNQRGYWIHNNLMTNTPYWLAIALWGGGKAYMPWGYFVMLQADVYLDLESWIYTNTGLRVLAYSPETGVGSRKQYSFCSYMALHPHLTEQRRVAELVWDKGQLEFSSEYPFI